MLRRPGAAEQTWARPTVQRWPQVLRFSGPRINLLSALRRRNGFTGIEKAIVHDASSRPPNGDYDLFWCKFGFGKCFGTSSPFNHWASHRQLSYKIHFLSHITFWWRNGWLLLHTIREDNTSKWWFFFFLVCSGGTHLLSFFKCRVTVKWLASEFFGNFSHRCSRSAGATALHRPMPPSHGPATALLTLKALVFFAKLEPTLHCTFISSS